MPVASGVVDADVAVSVHHVGDNQNLRILAVEVLVEDVNLEVAEPAAEGDVPVRVDGLVPEQQHGMFVPGLLDGVERRVVEIVREVDAMHFGSERRLEWSHVEGHRRGAGTPDSVGRSGCLSCMRCHLAPFACAISFMSWSVDSNMRKRNDPAVCPRRNGGWSPDFIARGSNVSVPLC